VSSRAPSPILAALRQHTRDAHQRVEAALPVMSEGLTIPAYVALLRRLHWFYGRTEGELDRWATELRPYGIDLEARRKEPLLARDLWALGAAPLPTGGRPAAAPSTVGRALGAVYVVEGATLGGQVVRRQLARTLGLTPSHGCAFFASYGDRVGPMWRECCAGLERYGAAHADDAGALAELLAGAVDAFRAFERCVVIDE
jgi:heme oxygenase (biliverdin-IX-beta and delta-forming)